MQLLNDKIDGSGSPENVLTAAEWNQLPTEIQNIITTLGLSLSNGDLNQLGKALAGYVANGAFYTDSGTANAYVLTPLNGKQAPPAYTDGTRVEFVTTNPNIGASTANAAGIGLKNIKLQDGSDPAAGDINGRTILKFDDANDWFELELIETVSWAGWLLDNAFYTDVSHDVSSEDTEPSGVFFKPDGTKMYLVGDSNNRIYQYSLSTAWDLSTLSYDSVSILSQDTAPQGVFFKPDGTKMYLAGLGSGNIYQYSLSTGWDLSTASYDSVLLNITPDAVGVTGIFFKPDGEKMYLVGFTNDNVYQYSLSTGWDLSTASYDSVFFDISSEDTSPSGVFFKPDGTKMYISGDSNNRIFQYTLSTAWDLSTPSYDSISHYVGLEDTSPQGVFFKPDGVKMYMIGSLNDNVYQYSTGRPYQGS
jgi:sugar lactone lactonase YvrE